MTGLSLADLSDSSGPGGGVIRRLVTPSLLLRLAPVGPGRPRIGEAPHGGSWQGRIGGTAGTGYGDGIGVIMVIHETLNVYRYCDTQFHLSPVYRTLTSRTCHAPHEQSPYLRRVTLFDCRFLWLQSFALWLRYMPEVCDVTSW